MVNKPVQARPSPRRAPVRQSAPVSANRARRRVKPDRNAGAGLSPDERMQLITLGAFYRAQARGFAPGRELEDWLEAESEVDGSFLDRSDSPDAV